MVSVENRYELWKVDEYGQGVILASNTNYEELVVQAKKFVNDDNIENALSGDEKLKNWESYFVEILDDAGEPIDNALYAGKNGGGKHQIQLIVGDDVEEALLADTDVKVRIFVGRDDKGVVNKGTVDEHRIVNDLYASDMKRIKDAHGNVKMEDTPVSEINDRALQGKTSYFVRKVRAVYSK